MEDDGRNAMDVSLSASVSVLPVLKSSQLCASIVLSDSSGYFFIWKYSIYVHTNMHAVSVSFHDPPNWNKPT